MFKRDVLPLDEVLRKFLREEGLEVPLQQKRLIDAWEVVTGNMVSRYTAEKQPDTFCEDYKSCTQTGP